MVLDGGGEETGQMNSTCRGEGEGLNCKTRRQRSCALKACRHKRCVVGGAGGEGRLGGGSALWGRGSRLPPRQPPPQECRATAREAGATSWGAAGVRGQRQKNKLTDKKNRNKEHVNTETSPSRNKPSQVRVAARSQALSTG